MCSLTTAILHRDGGILKNTPSPSRIRGVLARGRSFSVFRIVASYNVLWLKYVSIQIKIGASTVDFSINM